MILPPLPRGEEGAPPSNGPPLSFDLQEFRLKGTSSLLFGAGRSLVNRLLILSIKETFVFISIFGHSGKKWALPGGPSPKSAHVEK